MRFTYTILGVLFVTAVLAQFDPAGGEPGSLAIPSSAGVIVAYADSAFVERGWIEIEDTSMGKVTHGKVEDALGAPDQGVISIGDGGKITLYFENPIADRVGFDFAIFENGFKVGDEYFLELAFVEVSVDGVAWFRFPTESLTDTSFQVAGFETLLPTQLSGFAGKHQAGFGTPFDLEVVGMDSIHFVRCVDVVGKVDRTLGSTDSKGRVINDPYPTLGVSGGFDFDAIATLDMSLSVEQPLISGRTSAIQVAKGYSINTANSSVYSMEGQLLSEGGTYYFQRSGQYIVLEKKYNHVEKRIYWVY